MYNTVMRLVARFLLLLVAFAAGAILAFGCAGGMLYFLDKLNQYGTIMVGG